MRLPTWSGLVKDHLLKNLDGYYSTFGWDKFPASDLASLRVAPSGSPTGIGPLWGMGLNYSMTGVFYNKALAAKIGMTSPPSTLAQLDALLAKAKAAGVLPVEQFDSAGNGGLIFPLQYLMADYNIASQGSVGSINNWVFDQPHQNINTPANLKAVDHLDMWIKDGYFNPDANAVSYSTMMGRFQAGKGLFIFDGDWESGNFDSTFAGKYGFFLFPPLTAGGKQGAMSAPLTYGIAATAKHADCAAFFLNWVATNPAARLLNVKEGGSNPGGPPSLPIPGVKPGTVTAQTLEAGQVIAKDNGAMGFIANATGSIDAEGWTPAVESLFAGHETPVQVLKFVQNAYQQELDRPLGFISNGQGAFIGPLSERGAPSNGTASPPAKEGSRCGLGGLGLRRACAHRLHRLRAMAHHPGLPVLVLQLGRGRGGSMGWFGELQDGLQQ